MLLLVLAACGRSQDDTDAPGADTADTDPLDTDAIADARCPYDDGGGFYTGGRFQVAASGSLNGGYSWEFPPTPRGGETCITLQPDTLSFEWDWIDGSFLTWNEARFDFDEDGRFDCSLSGVDFDCVASATNTSFEGIEGSPMQLNTSFSGIWTSETALLGSLILGIDCSDYGCAQVEAAIWGDGYGFPASIRGDFTVTPNE